jgi:predicted RNA-binding protein with PIN domain
MILIDGYNVIYKWMCLAKYLCNIDLARDRFIDLIANYQGYTGEEIIIVFDSSRLSDAVQSEVVGKGLQIFYAPASQGADLFIEKRVAESKNAQDITVVTGDSMERMSVIRSGGSSIRPEQFEKEVMKVVKRQGK